MEIITLYFGPDKSIQTLRETLLRLKYFDELFRLEMKLNGKMSNEYFIDRDYDYFREVLNIIRDNKEFLLNEVIEWELGYFQMDQLHDIKLIEKNEILKLNVGGRKFWTTKNTVCRFDNILKFKVERWSDDTEEIFWDRDSEKFQHLLSKLRNPKHIVPTDCYDELIFFGINPNDVVQIDNLNCPINDDRYLNDLEIPKLNKIAKYFHYQPHVTIFREMYRRCTEYNQRIRYITGKIISEKEKFLKLGCTYNFELSDMDLFKKPYLMIKLKNLSSNLEYLENNPEMNYQFVKSIRLKSNDKILDELDFDQIYISTKLDYPDIYQKLKNLVSSGILLIPIDFEVFRLGCPVLCVDNLSIEVDIFKDLEYLPIKNIESAEIRCVGLAIYLNEKERNRWLHNVYSEHQIAILRNNEIHDIKINYYYGNLNLFLKNKFNYTWRIILFFQPENEEKYNYGQNLGIEPLIDCEISYQVKGQKRKILTLDPIQSKLDYILNQNNINDLPIYIYSLCSIDKKNIQNTNSGIYLDQLNDVNIYIRSNIQKGLARIWFMDKDIYSIKDNIMDNNYKDIEDLIFYE